MVTHCQHCSLLLWDAQGECFLFEVLCCACHLDYCQWLPAAECPWRRKVSGLGIHSEGHSKPKKRRHQEARGWLLTGGDVLVREWARWWFWVGRGYIGLRTAATNIGHCAPFSLTVNLVK
jgi:hypothetical protein